MCPSEDVLSLKSELDQMTHMDWEDGQMSDFSHIVWQKNGI